MFSFHSCILSRHFVSPFAVKMQIDKMILHKLTWSHAKAENVGEDAGHAQVRHPGYIVLFTCGEES